MLGLYVWTLSPILAAAPVLLCHAPRASFLLSALSSSSLLRNTQLSRSPSPRVSGEALLDSYAFLPIELYVNFYYNSHLSHYSTDLVMLVCKCLEGNYNVILLYPRNQTQVAHSRHAINTCSMKERMNHSTI